jgi:hypothetical protein
MELKHYDNGRELMAAVLRGELVDRLPRDGVDYLNLMFMPEYPRETVNNIGVDPFGVEMELTPDGFTPTKSVIDDIEDWDDVVFPDPSEMDMESDAKKILANYDPTRMMLRMDIPYCHFERFWAILGFENVMLAFYEDPDTVHKAMQQLTDYFIEKFRLIKKHYDVDILVCHDDWGANKNMFISPEMWRTFIKPELKRIIDATHALGMYYEQHSCGHVQEIIPDLIELGVDCIQPLMATCNDIPMIKREYGDKIVLFGACDTRGIVDLRATEEDVRRIVRTAVETCAPGGRFIPSRVVYGAGNDWKRPIVEEEIAKWENENLK